MKKFIFMLVAMFAAVTMSAQTVEKSKFFDNTYANMLKDSGANIELVGFADAATGSDKRNMELSLARANAVADALIKCGVNKDKITVIGKGATEQIFGENDANRVVIFKTK